MLYFHVVRDLMTAISEDNPINLETALRSGVPLTVDHFKRAMEGKRTAILPVLAQGLAQNKALAEELSQDTHVNYLKWFVQTGRVDLINALLGQLKEIPEILFKNSHVYFDSEFKKGEDFCTG